MTGNVRGWLKPEHENLMSAIDLIPLLFVGIGLYLLGLWLIEAYFRRKEKFIDQLQQRMKGDQDGTCK